MTRLEALENVAEAARSVRDLERMLLTAFDTRLVADRLYDARIILDMALDALERAEKQLN